MIGSRVRRAELPRRVEVMCDLKSLRHQELGVCLDFCMCYKTRGNEDVAARCVYGAQATIKTYYFFCNFQVI